MLLKHIAQVESITEGIKYNYAKSVWPNPCKQLHFEEHLSNWYCNWILQNQEKRMDFLEEN